MMIAPGQLLPIIIASHHEKTSRKRSWFPYQWENSASCTVGSSACAATTRIRTGALRSKLRAVLTAPKLAPVCSGPWSREGLSSLWPLKTGSWRKKKSEYKMISVIHPAANHFPNMGSMPMLTGQTAAPVMGNPYGVPFKADQISSVDVLYRRRGSGYTHLSNSWNTPGVNMKNAVSTTTSRSLSNYNPAATRQHPAPTQPAASTSNTSRPQPQPVAVVAPVAVKSSSRGLMRPPAGKDFSKPLFVDCSIEYELPNAPKIPKNSLPILMIHPGYKQKMMMKKEQLHNQCSTPNCQCKMQPQPQQTGVQHQVKKDIKAGMKRSYNTMNSNATVTSNQANQTTSSDFYMKHLQPRNHPGKSKIFLCIQKKMESFVVCSSD